MILSTFYTLVLYSPGIISLIYFFVGKSANIVFPKERNKVKGTS